MNINNNKKYLLALHSSTGSFGVAVLDLKNSNSIIQSSTFEIEKKLSNDLLQCVDKLLPKKFWSEIARLAVATGPGGFTGTRLSIAMARIIAQQVHCPLDGVSSFALMASRLEKDLKPEQRNKPFWIKECLKRRGLIAGKYQIKCLSKKNNDVQTLELVTPRLLPKNMDIFPSVDSKPDIYKDTLELLNISLSAHKLKTKSDWRKILPIYPTSPVDKKNELI
tara:strand:+ start:1517 stop:2182 length:666 start_codon:yes stop_codon:yes gene_type:complete